MAESIEGGAYRTAQGMWIDANGQPLPKAKIALAEAAHTERAAMLAQVERDRQALEAARNPAAQAIAQALAGVAPAAPVEDVKK